MSTKSAVLKAAASIRSFWQGIENSATLILLLAIALLPSIEVVTRALHMSGIRGSADYLQHLVLWLTFVGGLITSREKKHLSLSIASEHFPEPLKTIAATIAAFASTAVCTALAVASYDFVSTGFEPGQLIGGIPVVWLVAIMPFGYGFMAFKFVVHGPKNIWSRLAAVAGITSTIGLSFVPFGATAHFLWPIVGLMVLAALAGAPVFVVLGGLGAAIFFAAGDGVTVLANEAYTQISAQVIPTIPLFSLAGFILSESKAGERLVNFFRAAFGWMPGGMAIMATLICAFFTTFTGASGVTILALGGLLSFVLIENRYPKKFTYGLLTASGSIGLLFPPSLPVILYGVVAHVNIKHLFIGGALPGLLMVLTVAIFGIFTAKKSGVERVPFIPGDVWRTFKDAFWEILTPFLVLASFFGGFTTLVETGALTVVYILITQLIIHRDIPFKKLPTILVKCVPLISGVLLILAAAKGVSYCVVDAEIPTRLSDWTAAHIHSKYLFLFLLNIILLFAGSFLEIFSSIIVLVPVMLPLGALFGIDPLHLGIIFLVNMELGYMFPPMGLNLFLSSFRFGKPMGEISMATLPFLVGLFITVMLITYVPFFTTVLLKIFPG